MIRSEKVQMHLSWLCHKITSLIALKAYNAMSSPGGAAISHFTPTLPLILMYALGLCIVNVHWCRNGDRFFNCPLSGYGKMMFLHFCVWYLLSLARQRLQFPLLPHTSHNLWSEINVTKLCQNEIWHKRKSMNYDCLVAAN